MNLKWSQTVPSQHLSWVLDTQNKVKMKLFTHGSVVIAAITSCTNTSNPNVMVAAGLLAKKAVEKGLKVNQMIKTSLAPGFPCRHRLFSQSRPPKIFRCSRILSCSYGCTTCIGNSGPLDEKSRMQSNTTISSLQVS